MQPAHKFCHVQQNQVRKIREYLNSSCTSSASTTSSPSSSGRHRDTGRDRGRGHGQGRAPSAQVKAKATAQADTATIAKDENTAGYWRAAEAPGNTFIPEQVMKWAPPGSKYCKDDEQGRWIGDSHGVHLTKKSWTPAED